MGLTRKGKITFKMKRVLITGGSGFIGAAIVNRLLELGHDVTVLDDNSRGSLKRLQRVKGDFKFIEGSITDKLHQPVSRLIRLCTLLTSMVRKIFTSAPATYLT